VAFEVEAEAKLQPTVSRPLCLGVELPSGTYDQIFLFSLTIMALLRLVTLSDKSLVTLCDERMGL
jgi:Tfp pilus assembly protein PilO